MAASRQTVRPHLVPNGFLGWKAEGVHLWELGPQLVVQLSELGVASVDVPLVVQDADVNLRTGRRINHHSSV